MIADSEKTQAMHFCKPTYAHSTKSFWVPHITNARDIPMQPLRAHIHLQATSLSCQNTILVRTFYSYLRHSMARMLFVQTDLLHCMPFSFTTENDQLKKMTNFVD